MCKLYAFHIIINYVQAAPKAGFSRILKVHLGSAHDRGIQLLAQVTWINSLPLHVVHSLNELLRPPATPRLKELLSSSTLCSTTLPGIQGNSPVPGAPKELAGVNLICFLNSVGDGEGTLHPGREQFNYPQGILDVISPFLDGPEGSSYLPTSDSTLVPNSSFPSVLSDFFLKSVV